MSSTISILLFAIFITLGIIHFNWFLGGAWGLKKALPTKENGETVLNPKKFDSAIVGLGLTLFGLFYLSKSELLLLNIPNKVVDFGDWIVPGIFALRAIGDFKYIGFFKKIKNTEFAKADSVWFSPLCLAIGLLGVWVALTP